ncbi:MAG: hypothetical protein ACPG8W_01525 [Candidatus Promineifilaceae bacterium]
MLNLLKRLINPIRDAWFMHFVEKPDTVAQLQLRLAYQNLVASGQTLPSLDEVGFKAFSQTDEDGILWFIFSIIGVSNRRCVEICAGNGIECNTANLIVNHGWHGMLVEGDKNLVQRGQAFYRRHAHTQIYPPVFVNAWITRDNVNAVLRQNQFSGEVDLLSIDMDGVDYWIWDAIIEIDPRVVVVEYQDILGAERAVTVPYQPDFDSGQYPLTDGMPNFCGASLAAFVKLAAQKGYRLVGCNRYGFNAFFVKSELGVAEIPTVSAESCFQHPKTQWGITKRYPLVKDLPWEEV